MPVQDEVREWLLKSVQLLVDSPEKVTIKVLPGEGRTTFRVQVDSEDIGKVIGRQGRTSQSIRILAAAAGIKIRWRFIVDIDDGNNNKPHGKGVSY